MPAKANVQDNVHYRKLNIIKRTNVHVLIVLLIFLEMIEICCLCKAFTSHNLPLG